MSETTIVTQQKSPVRKPKRIAVFGTVVLVFAIIGMIATIVTAAQLTINLVDNTAQKNQFKQAIFPLVLLDPPAFDAIGDLDSRTVVTAAMWDFIIFADKEKYELDDLNNMTVPEVDIEAHIVKLFGTDAVIEHQEIADSDLQILYDVENKAYSIPSTASMASYVPEVETITRQGDTYTLKVGYVPSGTVWGSDITGIKYEPEPDKYLNYILKKVSKDNYIITAVSEIKTDTAITSSELTASDQPDTTSSADQQTTSEPSETTSQQQDTTSSEVVSQ